MTAPDGTTLTKQQEVIVAYLTPGRTLTNIVAITCLGVGSLSSRIAELRRKGYEINVERDVDSFSRSYFKYTMEQPKGDADAQGAATT